MRIAEIIGTVTLNRCHPSFDGASLKLAVPLSLANVTGEDEQLRPDLLAVWDDLGAGHGSRIALAEGPEACRPFRPEMKPVNAYNAAIIDEVVISH